MYECEIPDEWTLNPDQAPPLKFTEKRRVLAQERRDWFFEWIRHVFICGGRFTVCRYLGDFLCAWLACGGKENAEIIQPGYGGPKVSTVQLMNYDYGLWMHTVALIITAWAEDPSLLTDPAGNVRKLEGVYAPNRFAAVCFDPRYFDSVVAQDRSRSSVLR